MSHFTWKSCTLVDHFLPPRRARFLQEKELAQKQSQSTNFVVDNNEKTSIRVTAKGIFPR